MAMGLVPINDADILGNVSVFVGLPFALKPALNVSSTTELERVEVKDHDLLTEYKRGFPAFKASNTSLLLIVFPDTHFYSPTPVVPSDDRASTACRKQILDLVPQWEVQDFPMPRLPNLFTRLCSRFFESGDLMARITSYYRSSGPSGSP
ncbi:hypothetical protein VN97_g11530 [Penicillium thymicola]|uniref:Uncharacterized protein n=1 Tax=Penicillium thymicola TaxID=293382 RepID=A0AAI9T6X6_PENTH|nr:hypothetical protein VN97_g11530 [Penicillium thymicola]